MTDNLQGSDHSDLCNFLGGGRPYGLAVSIENYFFFFFFFFILRRMGSKK